MWGTRRTCNSNWGLSPFRGRRTKKGSGSCWGVDNYFLTAEMVIFLKLSLGGSGQRFFYPFFLSVLFLRASCWFFFLPLLHLCLSLASVRFSFFIWTPSSVSAIPSLQPVACATSPVHYPVAAALCEPVGAGHKGPRWVTSCCGDTFLPCAELPGASWQTHPIAR